MESININELEEMNNKIDWVIMHGLDKEQKFYDETIADLNKIKDLLDEMLHMANSYYDSITFRIYGKESN